MAHDAQEFGVMVDGARLDWTAAQKRKDAVVRRLTGGVRLLLDRAKVQVLSGTARFTSPSALDVTTAAGMERVEAADFVLATGSRPAPLPIPGLQGPAVLTSDAALALDALPESLLIIGAGPIGVEFATLFSACGVKVTLVEVLSRVLPTLDADLGVEVDRSLKKAKVRVLTASKVVGIEARQGRQAVTISSDGKDIGIEVEKILTAVGRRPNVEDLALDLAGVAVEKTGIKVDEHMRTSAPRVYAIGDVVGRMLLAHVAMHEGLVAVENALGKTRSMNYAAIPGCVFSWPEVASVGLSEEQAKAKGHEVLIGKFPFRANGKALAYGEHDGLAKIVAESKYGQVLGVHIVGPHASDLIQEGTLALGLEVTLDELEATVHPHPTLSEALAEATLAAKGRPLHI